MRSFGVLSALLIATVALAGQDSSPRPVGTVNEVMIGIVYGSSNAVNNAAYEDPDAPTEGFSFDSYTGWLNVEAAAVAMAESAALLAIPGRMCSNGEMAPVDAEDWMEWLEDLRESGMAAYRAAQNRSQETLIELSEQLIGSCVNCHAQYLDVGGDPNNRCRR